MDLYDAINNRMSVRAFGPGEVPEAIVSKLLEAAVRAPTAGNLQPWRFYVVRDPGVKHKLAGAAGGQSIIEQAPVVVVATADLDVAAHGYGSRGETLYAIQDTAAAVQNILLSVVAEGFGACWVGAFDEKAASRALGLPPGIRPVAMVPIGRPAGVRDRTRREPFEKYTEYV